MRTPHCVMVAVATLMGACAAFPSPPELPPFFTEDATLLHAHEPAVHGIEAIRDHYRDLKLRAIEVSAEPTLIDGAGAWAYLRGTSDGLFQLGTAEPARDRGAFIWILRKQDDGTWKVAESFSVPLSSPQ